MNKKYIITITEADILQSKHPMTTLYSAICRQLDFKDPVFNCSRRLHGLIGKDCLIAGRYLVGIREND